MVGGELLRKPVSALIPLEVSNLASEEVTDNTDDGSTVEVGNTDSPGATALPRKRRVAAQKCQADRQKLIAQGDL